MKNRTECLAEYGSDYMIQKRVKEGKLFEVGKAVYSKNAHVPELAVLSYQYPQAVITMRTAFYLHGLTDVIPDSYDFATKRDAAKIRNKQVKQYFAPDGFFDQGAETLDYKGYQVHIYNKERMLIELLRYKSKLPFDYYKEILQNYRKIIPTMNMQIIQDYIYAAPKNGRIMELLQMEVL